MTLRLVTLNTLDYEAPRTVARALEEFSDELATALVTAAPINWAAQLGLGVTSDALKTTFPIPLDAAGYKELKGDIKFRSLYHREAAVVSREWSDGVEIEARRVAQPDFAGWMSQPAAMAEAWLGLPNQIVADLLALSSGDGPLLDLYKDPDTNGASATRLFAAAHPYNVLDTSLGTFDNRIETTVAEITSGACYQEIATHFSSIKGANGRSLGLRFAGGTYLVPTARDELFRQHLEHDTVVRVTADGAVTQNNIFAMNKHIVAAELADDDVFYAFCAPKPGLHPWGIQTAGSPEPIVHDESSHYYKTTRKVALAYVGAAGAAMLLPHCIVRVTITG